MANYFHAWHITSLEQVEHMRLGDRTVGVS
jgi:hypothetical protein